MSIQRISFRIDLPSFGKYFEKYISNLQIPKIAAKISMNNADVTSDFIAHHVHSLCLASILH